MITKELEGETTASHIIVSRDLIDSIGKIYGLRRAHTYGWHREGFPFEDEDGLLWELPGFPVNLNWRDERESIGSCFTSNYLVTTLPVFRVMAKKNSKINWGLITPSTILVSGIDPSPIINEFFGFESWDYPLKHPAVPLPKEGVVTLIPHTPFRESGTNGPTST